MSHSKQRTGVGECHHLSQRYVSIIFVLEVVEECLFFVCEHYSAISARSVVKTKGGFAGGVHMKEF